MEKIVKEFFGCKDIVSCSKNKMLLVAIRYGLVYKEIDVSDAHRRISRCLDGYQLITFQECAPEFLL